ncbi:MAG: tRNA (guanosine(37)-N1)-methyltransferase TrmD [Proteobacteria bacterium]|nr:tRNA (guanosine(37)-N1)-methyltransferase TrmD [Pseudomonadota bacterium]
MNFKILTIFPELFSDFSKLGLVGRACAQGQIKIEAIPLRQFAINTHGQIDDSPYGGGSGMVLMPEAAEKALTFAKQGSENAKVILFSPRGKKFNQAEAKKLASQGQDYIFLCTRYEGVDQRVIDNWVDEEYCLGDYVLMGGEVPAMAVIESVSRLLPEVLGNPESIASESFEDNLLEYPQYTKPSDYKNSKVPDVLLSGNHQEIAKWRKERAVEETIKRRPDIYKFDYLPKCEINVALIHYPVMNKRGEIIVSSITTLDVHDIARSCKTYGVKNYYVVHPTRILRKLNEKIATHWETGYGLTYNPNRSEALETLKIMPDLDDVISDIETRTGKLPKVVTTSAKPSEENITFLQLKQKLYLSDEPYLILFGTGWGLADEILNRADMQLEPINGLTPYNHLSVRSAAAIIFDRLISR